jgi:hypothetical protein
MQTHIIPDVDQNTCWVCNHRNPSYGLICECCGAHLTPTNIEDQKQKYRIFSFGPHAYQFSACQKLHASLLEEAVQILKDETLVAVRVGVDPRFAILIKDADGTIRSTIVKDSNTREESSDVDEFMEASRTILNGDPDPTSGKHFKLSENPFL